MYPISSSTIVYMVWNHKLAHFLLSGGEKISDSDISGLYKTENLEDIEKVQKTNFKDLPKMLSLYENIELKVLEIVKEMHAHGIYINREKLVNLRGDYENKREVLSKKITEKLGPINLNSPRQLGQVLVLEHKLNLPKTKTGQYTTTSDALSVYAKSNEVVREILEFRALDKIINTYILPVLERLDESSRIHPDYDLMSAATGRMAAHNPNIQSTPVTGVYGDVIRSVFAAPHGKKLVAFDYSQQELRILAYLSQDAKLHDAFAKGVDIHVLTASSVLQIPEDKIGKTERNIGKTLNFGIIYGETPYGLAKQLGKTPEECAGILRRYFETYYGVKKYFDNLMIHAKIHGYVETILGRRRGIPGQKIYTPKKSLLPAEERIIKNFPIQGSAADMTKKAMVDIWNNILPRYPQVHMIMQIHDELVFEYDKESSVLSSQLASPSLSRSGSSENDRNVKDVILGQGSEDLKSKILPTSGRMTLEDSLLDVFINDVKDTMEKALPLSVPVVVDAKIGDNWGEI